MLWQRPCFEQRSPHGIIAIVPPAISNVLHITPFKYALDDKARLLIIIEFVEVHIPEDAASEDRLGFDHSVKLTMQVVMHEERAWLTNDGTSLIDPGH